jgi:hypothetical protein
VSSSQQEILSEAAEEQITIDTKLIPQHTKEVLAAGTLDFIHSLLNQPGGRKALDAKKAELNLC